mgnify:CR=1 FL=1|nr:hypothetical protein [uncultured Flavobacterium sp.]
MSHGLFPELVSLIKESHTYLHQNGDTYTSFSTLYGKYFVSPFNKDLVAKKVAEKNGTTQEAVLTEWDSKTENGSRIDEALERYAIDGVIFSENLDVYELVKSVLDEYKDYHRCFEQVVVYNEDSKTAGSLDKGFLFGPIKSSNFGLSDFKAFESDDLHFHRGWCKAPFNYLPNTKYTKIAIQLSYYGHLFEELTGRRCRQLFIHLINPITKTHQKIPVMYMKSEIIKLLELHKEKSKVIEEDISF